MGFNFLDSVALNSSNGGATRGIANVVAFVGTGMIMYGVYRLASKSLGLDKPKKSEYNGNMFYGTKIKTEEEVVEADTLETESDDSEDAEESIVETAKSIAWIFGGMILRGCVSIAKNIVINRLGYIVNKTQAQLYSFFGTNRYCVDVMKEASKDIYGWSNLMREDQVQFNRGKASGIAESAAFVENMFKEATQYNGRR